MKQLSKNQISINSISQALYQIWGEEIPKDTADRVFRYWQEFVPTDKDINDLFKTFECGHDQMVVVSNIPYQSICEHHLLPFFGVAHIVYLPQEKVLGLSKFGRIVDYYAKRPQIQEKLTSQIGEIIQEKLNTLGVMVVLEGTHTCMAARGVLKQGSVTKTSYLSGVFKTEFESRQEALKLIYG